MEQCRATGTGAMVSYIQAVGAGGRAERFLTLGELEKGLGMHMRQVVVWRTFFSNSRDARLRTSDDNWGRRE